MSKDGRAYIYLVSEEGNGDIYRFVGVRSMGGEKRGGLSINSFQL